MEALTYCKTNSSGFLLHNQPIRTCNFSCYQIVILPITQSDKLLSAMPVYDASTPKMSHHPLSWDQISASIMSSPFMCCHLLSTSDSLSSTLLLIHIRFLLSCFHFLYLFWMFSLRDDICLPVRSRQNKHVSLLPYMVGFF